MTLCDLCLGLTPDIRQYRHHASFAELTSCGEQCEFCQLISNLLEKSGQKAKAEEYKEHVNGERVLVNDTSITISSNQHYEPKKDSAVRAPYRLVVTCGPLMRGGSFEENAKVKAPFTILGIYAEEGTKAAETIAPRPVPASCNTDDAFRLMHEWITGCDQRHSECQIGFMDAKNQVKARTLDEMAQALRDLSLKENLPLPTRVLDLEANSGNDPICLLETNRTSGSYVALSHCWGDSQHLTTTKATLATRLKGIVFDDLPKTFQDAVVITRRLGLRYIWIDSLCIIQDDLADWEQESALMGEVYRNAYFTIAAAAGVDGDAGCFRPRKPVSESAISLPFHTSESKSKDGEWFVHEPRGDYSSSVWGAPLQSRAWTLQERALSRRIIHFAADQIYFECNKSLQFEDRCPESEHSSKYLSFSTLYFTRAHDDPLVRILMQFLLAGQWVTLIESFTERKLKYDSDAFPALSGIATHLSKVTQTEYAAGLWLSKASEDLLLWRVADYTDGGKNSRPATYRGPSWSWASMKGPILFSFHGYKPLEPDHRAVVLDDLKVDIQPLGRDPHGQIRSGTLTATGHLIDVESIGELSLGWDVGDFQKWGHWNRRSKHYGPPNVSMYQYSYVKSWDRTFWGAAAFDEKTKDHGQVVALLVKQKEKDDKHKETGYDKTGHVASFMVLLLSRTGRVENEFQRVGMGHLVQSTECTLNPKVRITII